MTDIITPEKVNGIIRKHAGILIPEFDANKWFAIEFNKSGSQQFGVNGWLGGPEYIRYRYQLDIPKGLSYNGDLEVMSNFRGRGLGRKDVELRENVCNELGISRVIINYCENEEFWEHLGYSYLDSREIDRLNMLFKLEFRADKGRPMFKEIASSTIINPKGGSK